MASHVRNPPSLSYTATLSPGASYAPSVASTGAGTASSSSSSSSASTLTRHPAMPSATSFPSPNFPFSFPSVAGPVASRRPSASAPFHVSKTYRQASSLLLTRRLPEALTTLAPLVTPASLLRGESAGINGTLFGGGGGLGPDLDADADAEPAPVATASRTTRIKVWSLYLTILNAVLEMEPDEGKDAFGTQEWRAICTRVREGGVWEEVVRHGYHGVEADVDSDVVTNLATLLLAHARSQSLTQKRLETYLAASDTPNFDDLTRHRALSVSPPRTPMPTRAGLAGRRDGGRPGGANTPRDLAARVKILELYTLHVLLRNDEWDYAREFISASPVLDDERREAFLQALQSLRGAREEEQAACERRVREHEKKLSEETAAAASKEQAKKTEAEEARSREREKQKGKAKGKGKERYKEKGGMGNGRSSSGVAGAGSAKASGDRSARAPPPGGSTRAGMILWNLKAVIDRAAASLATNSMVLTKLLAFVAGLVLMLSRRGVRERVRRILAVAWAKLRSTAGMGMRVTYM